MTLENELGQFLNWLKTHALKGFRGYTDDHYFDEKYRTYTEELEYLADEIKSAVRRSDKGHFEICKEAYEKMFVEVNVTLAKASYNSLIDKYLNEGFEDADAQRYALEMLWQDKLISYWLPVSAILKNTNGQEVFIVANERHIPRGKSYVLVSELKYLASSGRNPWEYVQNRRRA